MTNEPTGFRNVLDRYNERLASERKFLEQNPNELVRRPDDFLLALGEPTARFLSSLIVARNSKRILELGTSYGFSTLFFADAAKSVGGHLTTIDLQEAKQDYAREQLAEAGLDEHVTFLTGNAVNIIRKLPGPFDFVLIDLWKHLYIPCLNLLRPKLDVHAIIAADNMIRPAITRHKANEYRAAVRATGEFQSMLLPIGQGVELSCKWPRRRRDSTSS